jgi:hypothetical protein
MSIQNAAALLAVSLLLVASVPARAGEQDSGAVSNQLGASQLHDDDSVIDDDTVSTGGTLYDTVSESFNYMDASQDASYKSKNSYNTTHSFNTSGNIFAAPVAVGILHGAVCGNAVGAGSLAAPHGTATTSANASVTLSGSTLQGFAGVNSMNVNAGANSLQQSNVSISVVSVGTP